ncbi:MAG TPA: BTAD domain-containing putative transcriptional regulator [Streptosporangiaceae bacterium]|nr:BTAD domain-containing putative transcriptional regulator [Streptosporangiaceae bacterium]
MGWAWPGRRDGTEGKAQCEPELDQRVVRTRSRCGCQGEALAVYRRTREWLSEELGLEPGEDLRRLEPAILRNDPSLGLPRPPGSAARRSSRTIHKQPPTQPFRPSSHWGC